MKASQKLAIRTAVKLLQFAGLPPYFDIRASSSAKDVVGKRLGKRYHSLDELETAAPTFTAKPGERLAMRMYVDLNRKTVAGDGSLVSSDPLPRVVKAVMNPGALKDDQLDIETVAPATPLRAVTAQDIVDLVAPEFSPSSGKVVLDPKVEPRIVTGVMGNVRAHNGAPKITMGATTPGHVCDDKGPMRYASPTGPFLSTCSVCGGFPNG